MQLTEIQVFGMCVVVGYASYSDCNEISQVQLYLKMLRLKHSDNSSVSEGVWDVTKAPK